MKKVSKLSGTVGIEKFGSPPATLAKSPTLGTGKSKSKTRKVTRRIAANVDGMNLVTLGTVSYTHLTLPTNREV